MIHFVEAHVHPHNCQVCTHTHTHIQTLSFFSMACLRKCSKLVLADGMKTFFEEAGACIGLTISSSGLVASGGDNLLIGSPLIGSDEGGCVEVVNEERMDAADGLGSDCLGGAMAVAGLDASGLIGGVAVTAGVVGYMYINKNDII